MDDAQSRLDSFLAKFTPEVDALAHALIERMRARLPGAAAIAAEALNDPASRP